MVNIYFHYKPLILQYANRNTQHRCQHCPPSRGTSAKRGGGGKKWRIVTRTPPPLHFVPLVPLIEGQCKQLC